MHLVAAGKHSNKPFEDTFGFALLARLQRVHPSRELLHIIHVSSDLRLWIRAGGGAELDSARHVSKRLQPLRRDGIDCGP